MRTKALLGLAALAVSAITVVAQSNVYSLNVVGYVNVPVASGNNLLANPLKAGVTNGANEIMNLIPGSQFLTWNGAGFDFVAYEPDFGGFVDKAENPASAPSLPPGKGFFMYNPLAATTLTFVGEVVPAPGTTNALPIPSGYSLIGSPLPASAADITAAPVALTKIPGMQLLTWNGSSYNYAAYEPDFGGWVNKAEASIPAPAYSVGQGFFLYNPGAATAWEQSLP